MIFNLKKFIFPFLLIGAIVSVNLKKVDTVVSKETINTTPKSDFSNDSVLIIKDIFNLVKKASPETSAAYVECLKLIMQPKYINQQKTLWSTLEVLACKPNDLLKRDLITDYTANTTEKIVVNENETDCRSTIEKNLIPVSEQESVSTQKQLRVLFNDLFNCPVAVQSGKNIITAFLGPHRGSSQTNLYKVLNGN